MQQTITSHSESTRGSVLATRFLGSFAAAANTPASAGSSAQIGGLPCSTLSTFWTPVGLSCSTPITK